MRWPAPSAGELFALASFGLGWGVTWLGAAIASRRLRRSEDKAWIERARHAYPARRLVQINMIVVTLALGECVFLGGVPGLRPGLEAIHWVALSGLAGLIGVMVVGQRLERRLCRTGDRPAAAGISLSWLFIPPTLMPMLLMLALIPARWGWPAAAVLGFGAVLATFHLRGGWPAILRRIGLARPASPRLAALVEHVALRAGIRPRATLVLTSPHANAMVFPVPKLLVYTDPILDLLDDDELATVTAHELGHLAEPRAVYLARVAAAYLGVVAIAGIPLAGSFGRWAGITPLVLLPAGAVVMRRVGRRMEERADRLGREHEGIAEGVHSRALEKIYEANLMPAVMRGRWHVHPHLYDRLIASGTIPAYPRPEPPPRDLLAAVPTVLLVAGVVGAIVTGQTVRELPGRRAASAVASRARESYQAGDLEAAARLNRRAAELDPTAPHYSVNLALVLLRLGRLDEAEAAAVDAEARLARRPTDAKDVAPTLGQVRDRIRRLREVTRRLRTGPRGGAAPFRRETTPPAHLRD